MRELRVMVPVRLRGGPPREARRYGPTQEDMALFLAHKFCIDAQDMRSIVREVFHYIRSEVLLNGARISIHNFGEFRRLITNYKRNEALFPGRPQNRSYVRFRGPANHASKAVIRDPFSELVDANPDEVTAFYPDLEEG